MIATPAVRPAAAVALGIGLLGAVAGGCAHAPPTRAGQPVRQENPPGQPSADKVEPPRSGLRVEDAGTQSLFRVNYQGLEGSGALRLVLKIASLDHYRIETNDRFGRGLWRIDGGARESLLIDDRQKVYCRSEDGIRIPEVALEALPLDDLPAILLDRLPGGLVPAPGAGEYRDRQGRRWTVTLSEDQPTAWTFWEDGEPRIWWRRDASGEAILSHRAGTQLRWKRVASESMAGNLEPPVLEGGYVEISCDAWPEGTGVGSEP